MPDLVLMTTLRGHKRGVWAAQFSPVDQAVATASGQLAWLYLIAHLIARYFAIPTAVAASIAHHCLRLVCIAMHAMNTAIHIAACNDVHCQTHCCMLCISYHSGLVWVGGIRQRTAGEVAHMQGPRQDAAGSQVADA